MFYFYTPWNHDKTGVFLMFSGDMEVEHWLAFHKIYDIRSFHNLHYFNSFFKLEVYLFPKNGLAAFEYNTLNAENVA